MSLDLLLGIVGFAVTTMVVVAGILITPSGTVPAYGPERTEGTESNAATEPGTAVPEHRPAESAGG